MIRYSKIPRGLPREILLLKGRGCKYRSCSFCDYYLDAGSEEEAAEANTPNIARLTGEYGAAEVVCSGSFTDIYGADLAALRERLSRVKIKTLILEGHWEDRIFIPRFREYFAQLNVIFKAGVETFDPEMGTLLGKRLGAGAAEIAAYFNHCNLLMGFRGQTYQSAETDLRDALSRFERVCVNLFTENSSPMRRDERLVRELEERLFPRFLDDPRVDILRENTDFGVGRYDE
ncbi:MAG: radical SAM protein [Clostridiales bacterium]|jgi:hypothetical protein|nr:radical SAM protein [Clostridiales bacterium]